MVANTSTVSVLLPVTKAFLYYNDLKCHYESQRVCKRNSLLCNIIASITSSTTKVSQAFENVGELQLSKSLGLSQLAKQTVEKGAMLTQVTKLAIDLKQYVENKYLLNGLRRRLAQRDVAQDKCGITIESRNPSTFTWEAAYCKLVNMENSSKKHSHLSISQLLETRSVLEESESYSVLDIIHMFNILLGFNVVCEQLITCFPVWCIYFSEVDVLVNAHEVLLSPGLLDNLLSLHSSKERREGMASTTGVSLSNIRHHLLEKVPGLKEYRISINTVVCLMNPPRRKTIAAARYKGLIAARVPGKKNCYHEDSPDQHYLFAREANCRELAARFPVFSCDDMNKIKVGPLAVSRYHQIERFFPTEDTPNYSDHDFPVPGYISFHSFWIHADCCSC